jgi:hypothetical protein
MKLGNWARLQLAAGKRGARRAAACFAFSCALVGAWVLGVWALGTSLVYADAAPGAEGRAEPEEAASSLRAQPENVGDGAAAAARSDAEPAARAASNYPFDGLSRAIGVRGVECPEIALTEFAGEQVRFSPPARAAAPFHERLRELERAIREQSLAVYGRLPSEVLVAASYDCRAVSNSRRLSEHALGNAIDIRGFRFAARDGEQAFEVLVERHWHASDDPRRSRFLRALTETLLTREVFRTLLGPAHPDHTDHFHFDVAPHPYVRL